MSTIDAADEFLAATNLVYDECSHGVALLSRAIIATPSYLVGNTRMALVPALYAYWERFFRTVFAEFFATVSRCALDVNTISAPLRKLRLRRAAADLVHSHREELIRRADTRSHGEVALYLSDAIEEFSKIKGLFDGPIDFIDPEKWVSTESNVRFDVIKKNCDNIGLNAEALKKLVRDCGTELFPALNDLVNLRNDIAHGNVLQPLGQERWNQLQSFVVLLMHSTQMFLYECLCSGNHKS